MIKIALTHPDAMMPRKNHLSDAGYDFFAPYSFEIGNKDFVHIDLGVSLEFPNNVVLLLQGRSGYAKNRGIFTIGNVIDSGYRGTIGCTLVNMSGTYKFFNKGDKVCQGLFLNLYTAQVERVEVGQLSESDRGTKGFGSSGN